MMESYAFDLYKSGIYDKERVKQTVCGCIGFAPANADLLKNIKNTMNQRKLYTWKLPIMICEKELFTEMINSILDGSYNYQYYKAQLKVRSLAEHSPAWTKEFLRVHFGSRGV